MNKKLKSLLGYRHDSPFKNEPYIDIQSNNIDMSQTDKDLILIPNKGKPIIAKAGSGGYLFPNASKVTEVPLYQQGGRVNKKTKEIQAILSADKKGQVYKPNLQKLGNIEFDSNTAKEGDNGQLIVTDINTGKDFGVVRNKDGSYTWYTPTNKKTYPNKFLRNNVEVEIPGLTKFLASFTDYDKAATIGDKVLQKLSYYSQNRPNGQMSEAERKYRQKLADKISTDNYDPRDVVKELTSKTEKNEGVFGKEFLNFYLGLPESDSSFVKSSYLPASANNSQTYYTLKDRNKLINSSINAYLNKFSPKQGTGKSGHNTVAYNKEVDLGDFTIGSGIDDKGEYLSIYDKWDIDPMNSDSKKYSGLENPDRKYVSSSYAPDIDALNNPFKIYDRIYLNELPKETVDKIKAQHEKAGITPMNNIKHQAGGVSMKPVSPFMDLKMFKNRYKLEQLPTYQMGGILDNYIKTLPEEQQNIFMGEFQSLEPEVQQEVLFMLGGKYQMGGTAEVEGDETAVTPDSELVEFKGKKHKDGGIKVDLPNGTRIYSEYSKAPQEIVEQVLGKKTKSKMSYADLSKKFPTKPYMEILSDDKSDEYEKNGAQLKLMNNLSKLDTIFYAQEAEKKQVERKFQQGGTFNGGKFGGSGQGVNFDWTNYTFPIGNSILNWQATDKNKSMVFSHPEEGGNFYTDEQPSLPGFSPIRDNTQYPWREPYPTVTTGVRLPLMEPKLNLTNVTDDKPASPPAKVRGKQSPAKSKPVPNSGDSDSNLLEIPLPFGQLPTANLSNRQVTSMGAPETSPTLNQGDSQNYSLEQTSDDKDYPKRSKENNFGISSKLAGTIADIGLALSDKLRVSEPTLYDRRKYPLFTRFVDFDDKEVQRMYDKGIQQIQNSNLPEAQKQAQVSELLSKYQDYQGKVDYNNLQRYEAKREGDTNKLQQYLDQNIDIKVADTQDYKERKARVDYLRDQFLAQRKSRVVNSLKAYADYADKINMANQLYTDNYTINPITGKISYRPTEQSKLSDTESLVAQYRQNANNKVSLPNGATLTMLNESTGIVTDSNGKTEVVKLK